MIRGCSLVWVCLLILVAYAEGQAQDNYVRNSVSRDYFAIVEAAPGSSPRWLLRDIERNHLNKALVYLRQGKLREAMNDCIFVLDRLANHPKGLVILGFAAKLAKEYSLPVSFYERAVKLYPMRALTHAQYGKYLSEIGKIEEGAKRLQRAIEIDPQLKVAYSWLVQVYVRNGKLDLARQILQRSKTIDTLETPTPKVTPEIPGEPLQSGSEDVGRDVEEQPESSVPLVDAPN